MSNIKKLKENKQPKKILLYGDFPEVPTGFGTVMRQLGKALHKKGYIVDQVGINLNEGDKADAPYLRYYRAARSNRDQDTFGRQTLLQAINGMQGTSNRFFNDYDYVFLLQDPFIIDGLAPKLKEMQQQRAQAGQKVFKTIYYVPIDGEQYDKWLMNLPYFDKVIPFSNYGKAEIIKSSFNSIEYFEKYNDVADDKYKINKFTPQDFERLKNSIIEKEIGLKKVAELAESYEPVFHGTDTKIFKPLAQTEIDEFRGKLFQENKDRFIIGCVNRNQPRKDIPRVVEAFKHYYETNNEAFLYLHMDAKDMMGMDLNGLCNSMGLLEGENYATMNTYGIDWTKVPPTMLNQIYNSLDVMLTCTLGEGWGLTITEAMAAYCPVVAPNNTTIPEILGEGRGFIYDLEKQFATHTKGDFVRERHRGDIDSICAKLIEVHSMGDEVNGVCDKALEWVSKHTWSIEMGKMIKQIEK